MKWTTKWREVSWIVLTGRLAGREWSEARIKPAHIISLACDSQKRSPSELLPTPFMCNVVLRIYRKVKICNQSLTVIFSPRGFQPWITAMKTLVDIISCTPTLLYKYFCLLTSHSATWIPFLWKKYQDLLSKNSFSSWNTLPHTLRHVGSNALRLAAQPPVLLFSSHPLISL